MVTLDWRLDRAEGVTLVQLAVSTERPRRVRVENRLDGPVWPPRTDGRPATGWDDEGFEGVVPADGRLALGYATPAPPEEPPAEITTDEPADAEAGNESTETVASPSAGRPESGPGAGSDAAAPPSPESIPDVDQTTDGVLRTLGDPVVPRDAVPVPDPTEVETDRDERASERAAAERSESAARVAEAEGRSPGATGPSVDGSPHGDAGDRPAPVVPAAVRRWLADAEKRVAAVERTDDPGEALATAVAADRRALALVGRRAESLAARAGTVDRRPAEGR